MSETPDSQSTESFFSIFRSKRLTLRAVNQFYAWFVVAMSFYGLSLNSHSLAGDPYLNFFLTALVEIPGYAMAHIGIMEEIDWALLVFGAIYDEILVIIYRSYQ